MRSARVVLAMIRSRDRFNTTIRLGGEAGGASRAPSRVPWARVVRRDIPCGRVPSWIASSATTTTGGQRSKAVESDGAFRGLYSLLEFGVRVLV
jgi:hypothetical protein